MNGNKFDSDGYARYYVYDYNSDIRLIGAPSRSLIEESLDAEPTGAVLAYLAEDGSMALCAPGHCYFDVGRRA